MKNKIALATAALVAGSSFSTAEIVVNDFLSFEGFVDMSYAHTDLEVGGDDEDTGSSYAIDQVEISWLFDFDPVTAQIDLQYEDSNSQADNSVVEQAFATYHFDNGGAITAGRYASMIGFEAFEPTGLYQYSFAYDMELAYDADESTDLTVIPGYSQGVKFTYETDTTFFGISLQDSVFDVGGDDGLRGGNDATYGIEVAGSIAFDNGLSWFVGGAYEDSDDADSDAYMLNTYVTFETGAWIFAGELNYGDFEAGQNLGSAADLADDDLVNDSVALADEEVIQALLMANFAYSDAASVTGRISYSDHEVDVNGVGIDADFLKYTLAHGYAFTDNLFLVTELSYVDGEIEDTDVEALEAAVELIFSF